MRRIREAVALSDAATAAAVEREGGMVGGLGVHGGWVWIFVWI